MRRQCQAIVRSLDIPSPFDVGDFCARLAARRGRPIDLHPVCMPPGGPSGLWVETADRDLILYEQNTTRLHRDNIILHEVGHLLSAENHSSGHIDETAVLLPNLSPELIARVLRRTTYTEEEEWKAEMIGSMIEEVANRWKPVSEWEARPWESEVPSR